MGSRVDVMAGRHTEEALYAFLSAEARRTMRMGWLGDYGIGDCETIGDSCAAYALRFAENRLAKNEYAMHVWCVLVRAKRLATGREATVLADYSYAEYAMLREHGVLTFRTMLAKEDPEYDGF